MSAEEWGKTAKHGLHGSASVSEVFYAAQAVDELVALAGEAERLRDERELSDAALDSLEVIMCGDLKDRSRDELDEAAQEIVALAGRYKAALEELEMRLREKQVAAEGLGINSEYERGLADAYRITRGMLPPIGVVAGEGETP